MYIELRYATDFESCNELDNTRIQKSVFEGRAKGRENPESAGQIRLTKIAQYYSDSESIGRHRWIKMADE